MTLFGLDLNAGRARMVAGPPADYAYPVPLEPPHAELPLAVNLAGERPQVGAAGLLVSRRAPHLARTGLLSALAEPARGQAGHRAALGMVLRQLARACRHCDGGVAAVPAYLCEGPLAALFDLAERAGLRLLGAIAAPLALALAAHAEHGWAGNALVVEVDEHALALSTVTSGQALACLCGTACCPRLGLRVWRERLLNAVADRCILQSRRDPRDCAEAEQALFDRLDELLDACRRGRPLSVPLQARSWYQQVSMHPDDTAAACAALTRRALDEIEAVCREPAEGEPPGAVIVSATAARLPGLVAALQERFEFVAAAARQATRLRTEVHEDFGEGLLEEDGDCGTTVLVLGPDAAGRAAHGLAAHFGRADLPPGFLDTAAPLPLPLPAEAGPARLEFLGEEYPLHSDPFALGSRQPCELLFDAALYPAVAPRQCDIIQAGDSYTLHDRSGGGTLLNGQPLPRPACLQAGDVIRLGRGGPALRFLGQPVWRLAPA